MKENTKKYENLPDIRKLWKKTKGDSDIKIAVLDGPVDLQHESLKNSTITSLDNPIKKDIYSVHGTFVSSLIFSSHKSEVLGIAPECSGITKSIYQEDKNGKLNNCSQTDIEQGILDALEHGAHIINISGGEKKTLDYLENEYKRIGLKPAYGESYFQDVPLMEVHGNISDELVFENGEETLKLKKADEFSAFSRRVQDSIDIMETELVFAGYGIVAPEYNWNDYADIDVKDKIVVVLVNDPGYGTKDESFFKAHTMTYYGRWTYKYEEAARQGAKGCLIVHETGPAGYPWDVVKKGIESAKLYLQDKGGYKNRCELEGWLTLDAAKRLFEFSGKDLPSEMAQAKAGKLKAYAMAVQANLKIEQSFKNDVSQNIIGLIEGSTRKDEAIVFTAHWDHLGIVHPVKGDSIVNGATDNASALAWMLEIAEAFTKLGQKPERTLVFIATTAEEAGLLGAYHYVANPLFAPEKTVAIFNTDVTLFLGKYKDVTITGYGQSELDDWVADAAKAQGRYIMPDQSPHNGMYFRSDHFPFAKVGVPAMFGKGYSDHAEKGKEWALEKVEDYWKNTYHKPSDEYHSERDDLSGLVDDAQLFFNVAYNLAQSDKFPKWKKGSEFKSIREKSMRK